MKDFVTWTYLIKYFPSFFRDLSEIWYRIYVHDIEWLWFYWNLLSKCHSLTQSVKWILLYFPHIVISLGPVQWRSYSRQIISPLCVINIGAVAYILEHKLIYEGESNENLKYFYVVIYWTQKVVSITSYFSHCYEAIFLHDGFNCCNDLWCHYSLCLNRSKKICYRTKAVYEIPSPLVHLL